MGINSGMLGSFLVGSQVCKGALVLTPAALERVGG